MTYRDELTLSPRLRAILNAYRAGRNDARVGQSARPEAYGAREKSAWAGWYRMGYDGLPAPHELTGKGVTP